MAVNLDPTAIFPNWAYAEGTITLPRTDLFELTAAACHPVTGDARAVALAFLKTIHEKVSEMAEKPLALTTRYNPGSFVTYSGDAFYEQVKADFKFYVHVIFPEETIADEPV